MSKRPNILLLFTDQQRYDTIGALGNPLLKTPVLDRLVERGVCFTNAYTPSPVCVPARYAMLTGQSPHKTGCVNNQSMPSGYTSLMEVLASCGYETLGIGKMHFTFDDPREMWGFQRRAFSEEVSGAPGDDFIASLKEAGYQHVHDPHGVRSEMYYIPQPSQLPAKLHNTTWVVDQSIKFLEERDRNRPFFLMTSFIKPHPPFEVPTPWNKLYRTHQMPLPKRPEGYEHLLTYHNHFQNRYKYRDQATDANLLRIMRAYYYACISFVDYNIGRLLDYLSETGELENTLIIFTSDHGELLGDYNSFGKRCFLDSAARIPLIVCGPGVEPGLNSTPISLLDVMPTCLEAAGVRWTNDLPGRSLLGMPEEDRTVYGQFSEGREGLYMIVNRRWKYIYSAPDNKELLFDRKNDPEETRNRAYNPLYREAAERMRSQLISYFQKEGYTKPLSGNSWREYPPLSIPEDPDALLLMQDPEWSLPVDLRDYYEPLV